VKRINKSVKRT